MGLPAKGKISYPKAIFKQQLFAVLPIVLWVIIGAVFLAGIFLLVRRLRYPKRWQQDDDFRYLPFAPFLCSVVAFYALNRDVTLNYWFFL
ncbi:MAG TPA: hypothetical protein ACHBW8_01885 [Arsenophonus nasoniae]